MKLSEARRTAAWAGLLIGTAATLSLTATPAVHAIGGDVRWTGRDVDQLAATLCEVGLFALACWLGAGLLAGAAAALPGALGDLGARLHAALLPRVLQRVLAGGAGLGIVLAPVAPAWAAPPTAAATTGPTATAAAPTPAPPTWPTTGTSPHSPSHHSPSHHSPSPHSPSGSPSRSDRVTVARGDSLWVIAARRLGTGDEDAAVAAYWPRLYRANRGVIGADPDLVLPGQRLRLPGTAASLPPPVPPMSVPGDPTHSLTEERSR